MTQVTLGDGLIALASFSGALGATALANLFSKKSIENSVARKVEEQVQMVATRLVSLEEQRREDVEDSKERNKAIHELDLKMVELATFQKNSEEKIQLLMSMYQNFLSLATAAQLRGARLEST